MTHPGRFTRLFAGALLAAAVAAAAPIVRWCPIRWDQISTRAFFECAADPGSPRRSCAVAAQLPAPVEGCGATCPMAGGCHRPVAPASGRAYCLDDPGMTAASPARSPVLQHPPPSIAPPSIAPQIAPLADSQPVAPAQVARPPTALLASRPPIRGPPLLAG